MSRKLRFIFFAPSDVQVPRVDRNCIVKACEAMASIGADVSLVSLSVRTLDSEPTATKTVWEVFGVRNEFDLVSVKVPLSQMSAGTRWGALAVKSVRAIVYPVIAARLICKNRRNDNATVLYCKNLGLVPGLRLARAICNKRALVLFEAHVPPRSRFQTWALRRVDGIVCNGHAVQRVLRERGLADSSRSIALHQGYDPEAYSAQEAKPARQDARVRLTWNSADKIAVYTGKVFWRYLEIEHLLKAASLLAEEDIRLVVVGGREDHVRLWRAEAASRSLHNVLFAGFIAPSQIPDYQTAADVLISYYPSGSELNDYRSPGKLFEYMAAGTPMVAADYASLREVLVHERNALLVVPDRPEELASAIRRIMNDPDLSNRLSTQAQRDVVGYTWTARAEEISEFAFALEGSKH